MRADEEVRQGCAARPSAPPVVQERLAGEEAASNGRGRHSKSRAARASSSASLRAIRIETSEEVTGLIASNEASRRSRLESWPGPST